MALNDENLEPGDPNYGRTIIRDRKYLPEYLEDEALSARPVGDLQLPERLSEEEMTVTFVVVRNFDGTPLGSGKVVVLTLTADQTDISDIAVYDSLEEVGN